MLNLLIVLAGLAFILLAEEYTWRKKLLKGENQRKLGHITLGVFAAFWPWIISWDQIILLGFLALGFAALNYFGKGFHYLGTVKRGGYGDLFYGLAILSCALITTSKIFFCLAILAIGLADGLAAVFGSRYGSNWKYKVFGQNKTIIGTMTFWLVCVSILGIGLLFTNVSYAHYILLLIILPPILAGVENVSIKGLDNLTVPLALIAALWLIAN